MSSYTLNCDHAIFTSVRTPMGEGYRIIAASCGLKPAEKQDITRNSPSHEALCPQNDTDDPALAAAFYPLKSGRLCVAHSCFAGAEHTGRGGQRVYTHAVVFDHESFQHCSYNPFAVLRAMVAAGLMEPRLNASGVLPELSLEVTSSGDEVEAEMPSANFGCLRYVMQSTLDEKNLVVNLNDRWLRYAEALIAGVPGPMRAQVSFSAGLRYSVGRCYRLQLLNDDKGVARARTTGQPVEFVEPSTVDENVSSDSEWIRFIERHWQRGDVTGLARRTAKAFQDVSTGGRERIGCLYNEIDDVDNLSPMDVLNLTRTYLVPPSDAVEGEMYNEFVRAAQKSLMTRLTGKSWEPNESEWFVTLELWRSRPEGTDFAHPLIVQAIQIGVGKRPLLSAEKMLDVARNVPLSVDSEKHEAFQDSILRSWAQWCASAPADDHPRMESLCARWRAVRPNCSILDAIETSCAAHSPH